MTDHIASDCEGAATGYRCWGEPGFEAMLAKAVEKPIAIGVAVAMREHSKLTAEEIEAMRVIVRREAREAERWEKIKTQVLGWGIIAIVGWIGALVLKALEHLGDNP